MSKPAEAFRHELDALIAKYIRTRGDCTKDIAEAIFDSFMEIEAFVKWQSIQAMPSAGEQLLKGN
jgi:hypothetical protein